MKIILLNGAPRSGKDTLANYLVSQGLAKEHLKYANGVREVANVIYPTIDWYNDEIKDEPQAELSFKTPRQVLIGVGMGMRENVCKNVWVDAIINKIDVSNYNYDETIVISDCGFQNEVDLMVNRYGANNVILLQIYRDGYDFKNDSRGYVDGFCSFQTLHNQTVNKFLLNGASAVVRWKKATTVIAA